MRRTLFRNLALATRKPADLQEIFFQFPGSSRYSTGLLITRFHRSEKYVQDTIISTICETTAIDGPGRSFSPSIRDTPPPVLRTRNWAGNAVECFGASGATKIWSHFRECIDILTHLKKKKQYGKNSTRLPLSMSYSRFSFDRAWQGLSYLGLSSKIHGGNSEISLFKDAISPI